MRNGFSVFCQVQRCFTSGLAGSYDHDRIFDLRLSAVNIYCRNCLSRSGKIRDLRNSTRCNKDNFKRFRTFN